MEVWPKVEYLIYLKTIADLATLKKYIFILTNFNILKFKTIYDIFKIIIEIVRTFRIYRELYNGQSSIDDKFVRYPFHKVPIVLM